MKKFTTLKEDILNENLENQERFNNDIELLSDKFNQIKTLLEGKKDESWYNIALTDVNKQIDIIINKLKKE
jgi:hypothetical protein